MRGDAALLQVIWMLIWIYGTCAHYILVTARFKEHVLAVTTLHRLSRMMFIIMVAVIGGGNCSLQHTRRSLISVHLLPDLGSGDQERVGSHGAS
jgi:hypothetical protein